MKKVLVTAICLTLSFAAMATPKQSDKDIHKKVETLLRKMTLEEKVGQLMQPFLDATKQDSIIANVGKGRVGSILFTKNNRLTPEQRNAIQKQAVEESRLGIPVFFAYDVIHGFKTVFPASLALASSWDEALVEECAEVAALECANWGVDMALSPMVSVARDPRWGRISEGAGEDVLLNSRMGVATVKGLQGDNMADVDRVASCVKHFVGDGAGVGGRDKDFTEISERTLLDTYLPPFKATIEAGCPSVMVSFNDVSGIPVSAHKHAMTDIVKDGWGFDGIMLSDWDSVLELQDHGIAADEKEAALKSFNAGMDMEMKSYCFNHIPALVKAGKISKKRLNDAVRRILTLKYRLGLFERPYVDVKRAYEVQLTAANRKKARRAAAESMILLKNNGVLPLSKKTVRTAISVVGPCAHTRDLLSGWIGMGEHEDVVTLYEGISNNAPQNIRVVAGTERMMRRPVSVVCVGERSIEFGESHNRENIELSKAQVEYIKEVKQYSSKVVVVVCSGRPLVLTPIMKDADVIVQAWHPGTEAGNGLADVLFGKVNPSGKTTCTFPKASGQVPLYYCNRHGGRPRQVSYTTVGVKPLFPFGYGLSYTNFEYSDFTLSSSTMKRKGGSIQASVTVKNTGKVDGKEVVQLYIRDRVASVSVPKKRLIDFVKVNIKAGESRVVNFTITPDQLTLFNLDLKEVVEKGAFDIWVGGNSEELLEDEFTVL